MGLSLLDTGQTAVIAGKINGIAATDAALTTSDGAATMVRNAAGDYTVTFGASFLSAPVVTATVVDATFAATEAHNVVILAAAATDVQFNTITQVQTAGTDATDSGVAALADLDFHFMVIGARNR